jgi:AcrR family transcriptional regulator
MPRSPDQFRDIRDLSRERILNAALKQFAAHGYSGTPVRSIAREAGVSQGLLYNYFASKRDLLRAIFERGIQEAQAGLTDAARHASPAEALEVLVRSALESVGGNLDFWRLSYQLRMQPDVLAELAEDVRALSEALRSPLEDLLRQAGSPHAALRASLLFATIDGVAQHYVLDPDNFPVRQVCAELVAMTLPWTQRPEGPDGDDDDGT